MVCENVVEVGDEFMDEIFLDKCALRVASKNREVKLIRCLLRPPFWKNSKEKASVGDFVIV